jgi:hypothetical protein
MKNSGIHAQFAKGLQPEDKNLYLQSADGFCTKWQVNLTSCTVNFGPMRQYSQGVEQTMSTAYVKGCLRIFMLLNTLHFNTDLVSAFAQSHRQLPNWTIHNTESSSQNPVC